jgi:histidinol-phosphate aminotransferase
MNIDIHNLLRDNIKTFIEKKSIENQDTDGIKIRLDKNENALGSPLTKWYHRYPDSSQLKLKEAIGIVKNISVENIFLGNGIYECIDLLCHCFCEPIQDNIIICPPTNHSFANCAEINNVEIRQASLLEDFQLDLIHLENLVDANTKIISISSPNHISGNSMLRSDIETILNNFNGLVVVDESYINYSNQKSFVPDLNDYPNLIIIQTLSRAWGLAGLQIGMTFASANIIDVLNKIKPPYNINQPTQELAIKALEEIGQVNDMIKTIVDMRNAMSAVFIQIPIVQYIYTSDANFLLVKFHNAAELYQYLLQKGIAVYDATHEENCADCLRITIGTEKENTILIDAIADYLNILQKNGV